MYTVYILCGVGGAWNRPTKNDMPSVCPYHTHKQTDMYMYTVRYKHVLD